MCTVKTGIEEKSYFFDSKSGHRVSHYNPHQNNINFRFNIGNGLDLIVSGSNIKTSKAGIYFEYKGEYVFIDDGAQSELEYVAYIINGAYDEKIETDVSKGIIAKSYIFDTITKAMNEKYSHIKVSNIENINQNLTADLLFTRSGLEALVEFKTISNIVNTNKLRKDLGLQFYPYIKGIDKYNAYYMSIFTKPNSGVDCRTREEELDMFFISFMNYMNELSNPEYNFRGKTMPVRNRILRYLKDKSEKDLLVM